MKKMKIFFSFSLLIIILTACSGNKSKRNTNEIKKDSIPTDAIPETKNTDSLSRNSTDFGVFISYFLNTCYYNNNIDSLIYFSSPVTNIFINKEAGIARYFNSGAFCNLYKVDQLGYNYSAVLWMDYRDRYKYSALPHYNKKPIDGFCDESRDVNGVYYYRVDKFPDAWDMGKDKAVKVKLPAKFDAVPIIKVDVLYEKWIAKKFYFAQINNIWYWVFVDDCDCSV